MATPSVFRVPPLDKRKRIPMKTIRAIAKHIAERFDPEQIIQTGDAPLTIGVFGMWGSDEFTRQ